MAQLSGIARALVRIIFGTDLPTGTHAEALQHYRRATELNPTRMIHRWAALLDTSQHCSLEGSPAWYVSAVLAGGLASSIPLTREGALFSAECAVLSGIHHALLLVPPRWRKYMS